LGWLGKKLEKRIHSAAETVLTFKEELELEYIEKRHKKT